MFERVRRHHVAGLLVVRERMRFKQASAPTPAPPQQTASAQTSSNVQTAVANAELGNVDQYNPYGSTTYQQNGSYTNSNGDVVPSYAQTTTLNPTLQSILSNTENTAQGLTNTGQTLANNYTAGLTGGPNAAILAQGPQALDTSATNSIYAGENALLQPTFQEQQQQLQDQLSRQGIPVGSQAYGNAETQLGTQQNQAQTAALGTATQGGIQSAGQMYNLALLGQQAPLSQLSQLYGMA